MKNDEKAYLIKYNCLKLIKTWHLKLERGEAATQVQFTTLNDGSDTHSFKEYITTTLLILLYIFSFWLIRLKNGKGTVWHSGFLSARGIRTHLFFCLCVCLFVCLFPFFYIRIARFSYYKSSIFFKQENEWRKNN